MTKQQAIETIGKFMELLPTDFPRATTMLAEEFVWENFLPPHVPFGGRYEGVTGLQTYLEQLSGTWVMGEIVFHDFVFDPETRIMAATGIEKNGKALATGRTCDMSFIWEFRFDENGKLSYLREHNDTASIGGAFDT